MIYFKKDLYAKALIELHDEVDAAMDIGNILGIINSRWTDKTLEAARQLDEELRKRYPIDFMLDIASKMPKCNTGVNGAKRNDVPWEMDALRQDFYGILANVLVKKGIIKSIEYFIDHVD